MALVISNLTGNSDNSPATSYVTASISPTASSLILVSVEAIHHSSVTPATPTLSGGGLSAWPVVIDFLYSSTGAARARLTVFRGLSATPGSGAVTISFSAAPDGVLWEIDHATGVDTTGSDGAGAVNPLNVFTTAVNDSGTAGSVTLSALASSLNGGWAAWGHLANETTTKGAGLTRLGGPDTTSVPDGSMITEWLLNTRTLGAHWGTSSNYGGVAIEVNAAPVTTVIPFLNMARVAS